MKTYKNRLDFTCEKFIEYALYTLIFFLPASKSIIEICASLAIVAWFIKKINNFEWPKISAGMPLVFFVAIAALTATLTTHYPHIGLRALFRKTLEYVLIFIIMAEVMNTPRRLANLIIIMAVSSFIIGIDGFYQHITGFDFFRRFPLFADEKVSATFQFSNSLGAYLATISPIFLALFIYKATNRRSRFLLLLLLGILLLCLLLTQARAAWFAFFVAFVIISFSSNKKVFLTTLGLFMIFVVFIAILGPFLVKGQIESLFNLRTDLSTNDRIAIWTTAWKIFLDKPVFGHGLGTFMAVFEKYKSPNYSEIVYAHNCYLQIAAETGIIGLAIFLWFVFSVIKSVKRKYLETGDLFLKAATVGILSGIVAYLVNSFFDTTMFSLPLAVLFWSLAGLAAAQRQPD